MTPHDHERCPICRRVRQRYGPETMEERTVYDFFGGFKMFYDRYIATIVVHDDPPRFGA